MQRRLTDDPNELNLGALDPHALMFGDDQIMDILAHCASLAGRRGATEWNQGSAKLGFSPNVSSESQIIARGIPC
ncbi:MAG: hypothetical protein Rhims3KO_35220 [Hyphomicrobiales bacterium]